MIMEPTLTLTKGHVIVIALGIIAGHLLAAKLGIV